MPPEPVAPAEGGWWLRHVPVLVVVFGLIIEVVAQVTVATGRPLVAVGVAALGWIVAMTAMRAVRRRRSAIADASGAHRGDAGSPPPAPDTLR
ncbi:hypothetical protein ACIBJD_21470 [Kitasatospora sp. NPDC050467]|uniref:hypothetical protein n=1 Tax=Kitasatospora sp. NPDC050467 TaxID=3364053 RepID=UPI0037B037ED